MELRTETEWVELWQGSGDFKNAPHQHDDWIQVTLPIRGTCYFTQEERSYDLKQGHGLIQPPGTKHYFHLGDMTSVIILKVRESGSGGLTSIIPGYKSDNQPHERVMQSFDTDEVVSRFRGWMLALIQGQASADPLAKQDVEQDVMTYAADLLGLVKEKPISTDLPKGITDPHILLALTYMHDCYANVITIDELAAIALQSRFHFIRSFREAMGTTPYQYLLRLRMAEAKNRLRYSRATIGQISADLGFSSTSQFHRVFSKSAGMTPQAYRLQSY